MKSAFDLAMERLAKETPVPSLTEEQREQLAEIDRLFKARIAEKEFNLGAHLATARQNGDWAEVQALEQQLQRELERLRDEAGQEKDKVRAGSGSSAKDNS